MYQNICDGSQADCENQGKLRCHVDPTCHGFTFPSKDMNNWLNTYKGVAICPNSEITSTPEGWNIFLKCDYGPGKKRIIDKDYV